MFNPVAPYRYLLPPCICLWQISQIQTCLCVVVGPGFVSMSPAFIRSSASHPAGLHGRLSPKIGTPMRGAGGFDIICSEVFNRCDSSTACRLCHLHPLKFCQPPQSKFSPYLHLYGVTQRYVNFNNWRRNMLNTDNVFVVFFYEFVNSG